MKKCAWKTLFSEGERQKINKAEKAIGDPSLLVALGDLFALGCHLVQSETDQAAGRRACRTVLRVLNLDENIQTKVMQLLKKNTNGIYDMFKPHIEITKLFLMTR